MAERRVSARLEATVSNFIKGFKDAKKSVEDLTQSTQNANKATQENSRFSEEAAKKIKLVADADQKAAKAAGLLYSANGQLVNANGKIVSSSQAAAHGVDAFSDAVYLANVEAQEAAAATEAAVAKQAEAYQTLAPAVTVAGGALTLAFGKMLHTYADFDKSMSEVQAATHETAGNMNLLREAAVGAGADTAFSASEAAGGIKELAKAGVDTQAIINGGLTGALSLAATDNIEVAKAAEIAASAMTQFKLSGEEVPHIADLLAAGAGKAQGGVEDLGMALNQSGLVANGVGLTIEETTGALTAFAAAGLTGSDSGTSFKTMLQSLTPNSKQAAELMDELGISAYDAQGQFVGMSEYAGILQGALKDMSDEQRQATLKTIFGSDAVRAASILYEEGADGIQKWEDAVNDAGYAAETAAAMQDNLAGDLEKLGGSFDTVFLQSGSAANDILRELVQTAEGFIDIIGNLPQPVLATGGIITGIAGGAALAGGALVTFIPKLRDTRDALRDLAPEGTRAGRALDGVSKGMRGAARAAGAAGAIMTAGVGLAKLAELSYTGDLIAGTGHVADGIQRIVNDAPGAGAALDSMFKNRNGDGITGEIDGINSAIDYLFADDPGQKFNRWGQDVVNSLTGIRGGKQIAEETFGGIDAELANLVNSGSADDAAEVFGQVQDRLRAAGVSAEEAAYLFPAYSDALNRASAESQGATEGSAELTTALDEVGVSAEGVVEDMEAFLDILFAAGVITRDERAAMRDYEAAIDEISASIEQNGKTLDVSTEKGRANQAAFDGLAASGQAYVEALAAGGATEEELQAAMSSTYESLITAAGQFGITGEAADKMAREVMGIPEDVKVESWMSEAARLEAEKTKRKVEELDGKTAHVWITTHENSIYSETHVSTGRGGTGGQTKATGGAIFGPGSGTSDDVPIWASNGEHMLTAKEVQLMGGHDAVYQFRASLQAGSIRGHATGGEIGGIPVGIPTASVMQSTAAPAPATGAGLPTINIEINGATDERRVARAVTDEITSKLGRIGVRIG
ncbi:phage tail tape measure protein [Glutamicibacter nicotianae]|uniref:phage tail tape measure protein n=1 Tax=Glutamicibacter nicotianae TaxID=37929 RepID=UPI0025522BA5|nr:phage tail tape measure protein [Glutamicibacter nicotianae]WIV42590.1 phage tail tape measure protein [Glutamicibacter nicotianae]